MLLDQLLISLRRQGDEAQLTQALAAFASHDRVFARELLCTWLAFADAEKLDRLGPIPVELECRAEVSYGHHGRIDLEFSGPAESFLVLVELKLFAGYGDDQLLRYVRAAKEAPFERSAVLAVTRNVPSFGENEVDSEPEWLGSVRWGKAFDAMAELESAAEPQFSEAWRAFLRACKSKGDFGVVADPNDLIAWARYTAGKQALIGIMNELAEPALEAVRSSLITEAREGPGLVQLVKHKSRTVWPWQDRINIQMGVNPSLDSERLRIQFVAIDGSLYFTVEARFPDTRSLSPDQQSRLDVSTAKLENASPPFRVSKDWEHYWARVHPAEEWMKDPDGMQERLLELIRKDVSDLVDSGIFDALPPTPGHESHEPETIAEH